jgi:predicted glycogen debranching enzyme
MNDSPNNVALPPVLVVPCVNQELDSLLSKEWLLGNKIGAYASSTVLGCNTRRYHALLVAATTPPVGRVATLSTVMEQLVVGDTVYDLATNEFAGSFSPQGRQYLVEFRNDIAPTFIYRVGNIELVKEIMLADQTNAVAVRYTLRGQGASLRVWPFAAMRDFHALRKVHQPHQMTFQTAPDGVIIHDRLRPIHGLHMVSREAAFVPKAQWWYRFQYRADISRGQEGHEDLYTPGYFNYDLAAGQSCQLTATMEEEPTPLGFETTLTRRHNRLAELSLSVAHHNDTTLQRLAMASDTFVVNRSFPNGPPSATILAGFHWFADWGRDAFISLPGLLLATGRFEQAKQVFMTFAQHISQGQIPNRFDDYSTAAHYNSIDASLWFIIAAERYLQATNDVAFWRSHLMPAADAILRAYHNGTRFDIHADADSLLMGGSHKTQLTWMDAALGEDVVTPRHGKAVEVNALWYAAHQILAHRCLGIDDNLAARCAHDAALIGPAFVQAFWNDSTKCLFDCITDGWADATLRPNQIFAVSLPYSPLGKEQQSAVLKCVTEKLLTPYGLRTLSPDDSRYRRRYGGSWESRDRAYHQGTVWAYLLGPYIEAYLKVNECTKFAVTQAHSFLAAMDSHLWQAGLGYVSEVFDGDAPYMPGGCIAQAWSVAEILRAKLLVAQCQENS